MPSLPSIYTLGLLISGLPFDLVNLVPGEPKTLLSAHCLPGPRRQFSALQKFQQNIRRLLQNLQCAYLRHGRLSADVHPGVLPLRNCADTYCIWLYPPAGS